MAPIASELIDRGLWTGGRLCGDAKHLLSRSRRPWKVPKSAGNFRRAGMVTMTIEGRVQANFQASHIYN